MNRIDKQTLYASCATMIIGLGIGSLITGKDIVSTKLIEPYKVVLTKVDGKVVKTYYYKQD